MEGGFGVGVEEEVAACVVLVLVVVVVGGSSVGSSGERGAAEGGTGAEVAVGCLGWRQRWSPATRLELRWCVPRLHELPDPGYDSAPLSRIPPWGTSPPRSVAHTEMFIFVGCKIIRSTPITQRTISDLLHLDSSALGDYQISYIYTVGKYPPRLCVMLLITQQMVTESKDRCSSTNIKATKLIAGWK